MPARQLIVRYFCVNFQLIWLAHPLVFNALISGGDIVN